MSKKQVLTKYKINNYIFLLLLLVLLFLRFPFLILIEFKKIPINMNIGFNIFENTTYLTTALIIILKRDSLSDYNIDFFALFIFMATPFARLFTIPFLATHYNEININIVKQKLLIQILISTCLGFVLLYYHPKLHKKHFKELLFWLLLTVVISICTSELSRNISILQGAEKVTDHPNALIFINLFFTQLGNAAIIEEPLFRGFLWGFLKSLHCNEYLIWLFQAALFMFGHIYYLGVHNYSFWILVPIMGLILGFLAWRSKSIGTSMIAHGLINSLGDIFSYFTL